MYAFRRLSEFREITENWIREYNEERPHNSLGDLTPIRMAVYAGVSLLLLNWLVMIIGLITEKSLLPVWLIALNLLVMVRIFVAVYIARVYKDGINKPKYFIYWDNTELHALSNKAKFPLLEWANQNKQISQLTIKVI
jgi:hypothetical protein